MAEKSKNQRVPDSCGPNKPGPRMKDVLMRKRIIFGSTSRLLDADDIGPFNGETHKWTCFVKPYRNEDMSPYISSVEFELHTSYPNYIRVVDKPPYEVTEIGYGEFDITIKIYFAVPKEKPVVTKHQLRLLHVETETKEVYIGGKLTIISERYDELIFQNPSEYMYQCLTTIKELTPGPWKHFTNFKSKERRTLRRLAAAKEYLKSEEDRLRKEIQKRDSQIKYVLAVMAAEKKAHRRGPRTG